jgi:hypothetical protein
LSQILKGRKIFKLNIVLPESSPNQGIVREIDMAVLPNVGSKTCLALVVISLIVILYYLPTIILTIAIIHFNLEAAKKKKVC